MIQIICNCYYLGFVAGLHSFGDKAGESSLPGTKIDGSSMPATRITKQLESVAMDKNKLLVLWPMHGRSEYLRFGLFMCFEFCLRE